jgi:hypothetical protein
VGQKQGQKFAREPKSKNRKFSEYKWALVFIFVDQNISLDEENSERVGLY